MASGFEIFGLAGSIGSTIDIIGSSIKVREALQNQGPDERNLRLHTRPL